MKSLISSLLFLATALCWADSNPFGSVNPHSEFDKPPEERAKPADPFSSVLGEKKLIQPGANGIIFMPLSQANLNNIKSRQLDSVTLTTTGWRNPQASVVWGVEIPKPGQYRIEISWSHEKWAMPMQLLINGKLIQSRELPATGHWNNFYSLPLATANFPAGKAVFDIRCLVPPGQYGFDLLCMRLIPVELDASIARLKKQSLFGRSKEELELVFGPSIPYQAKFDLNTRQGDNDNDWFLFDGLKPKCRYLKWAREEMRFHAALLDDKCIAFEISASDKSRQLAFDSIRMFDPDISFDRIPESAQRRFTAYTRDRKYKLVFLDSWFRYLASGLVREMTGIKDVPDVLKTVSRQDFDVFYQEFSNRAEAADKKELLQKCITGLNKKDVHILTGGPGKNLWWSHMPAEEWTVGPFKFITFYKHPDICAGFAIISAKAIQPAQALSLAERFLPRFKFESAPTTNPQKAWDVQNTGSNKRFKARWEFHHNSYMLEVLDYSLIKSINQMRLDRLKSCL